MKIKSISFERYKAFFAKQTMKLKPITILIGKNSSGKSSIAKLFTLFETSLSRDINVPLLLKNNEVELGGEFNNLFFANKSGTRLAFSITFENEARIEVSLSNKTDDLGSETYGLNIFDWKYEDNQRKIELQFKEGKYFDAVSKKTYDCEFKGFIPVRLTEENGTEFLCNELQIGTINVDYIGPFRILPDRYFSLTGEIEFKRVGVRGENAYALLGISKFKKDDVLCKKVGRWYQENFDGWELNVDEKSKKPLIQILLSKNETDVNIVDVGQGMNQALPLIVRANMTDKPDSIVVLEQPELHLHPAAHGALAELFARSAKANNQIFIIETHSENMLLRLRKLVVENDFGFTENDILIYWLEDAEFEGQELMEITIDADGVLSDWREGVFSEGLKELLEMQNAIKRKGENI